MKLKWTIMNIIGIIFSAAALVFIFISIIQDGGNTMLTLGLACVCLSFLTSIIDRFLKNKKSK